MIKCCDYKYILRAVKGFMFPDARWNFELFKLADRSVWRGLDPRAEGCQFKPRGRQELAGVLVVREDAKKLSQLLPIPLSKVPPPPPKSS